MTPLVSICLPNLNARPFLEERFHTILGQTLQDWELFVYDSHSDDGSWELIQDFAKKDARIRILQGPREGPYPAWNECLRNTTGEYVYIATSDDTMAPEFLERMVTGLAAYPDCDLAHSPVVIVDDRGEAIKDLPWPDVTAFADGIGDLVSVPHPARPLRWPGRAYRPSRRSFDYAAPYPRVSFFSNRNVHESMGFCKRF